MSAFKPKSLDGNKRQTIHQFHSGSATGDAVTNSLFLTQRFLRELGFASEIYVEHIGEGLEGRVHSFRDYKHRDDAFLIHHSMGHDQTEWVCSLRGPKVLVYHNITPAEFFPAGSVLRRYAEIGREQLLKFRPRVQASICDSRFNAEELEDLEFRNVSTIPLLIDLDRLAQAPWVSDQSRTRGEAFTVLFVGRIAENKCQHDVIEVFSQLTQLINRPTQLILVGGYNYEDPYYRRLRAMVESRGLAGRVLFAGKIPDEELIGWYRSSDVFLCLSEHEGFGVPLVESMVFNVPVLAYASTSVPSTLDGAGLLLRHKDHREIAALIGVLANDRPLRRVLLDGQRQRLQNFSSTNLKNELSEVLGRVGFIGTTERDQTIPRHRPSWQIEGPFETSYSLALLNREMARALEVLEPGNVSLFATEGPGDYSPSPVALKRISELQPLWERGEKGAMPDIVVRNLYPPRVADADGLTNLLYFAWEESLVPNDWVESFNRHLDGCVVLSEFVKKSLIDSGVDVPITVVGCGFDHIRQTSSETVPRNMRKTFQFLHVSSAFPRKGIDVLLSAYGKAFSSDDPVTLLIKSFPNIHNTVKEQIRNVQRTHRNYPDVLLINEDLSAGAMADLYRHSHAFVAPTRGEGFGLPMAEAMAYRLPVITTAGGGQADFCSTETSWLVDFDFARSGSHHGQLGSVWMEPRVDHLAMRMREVFEASPADLLGRTEAAKLRIEGEFTWLQCARRLREAATAIQSEPALMRKRLRLGWFSSWNAKCGIATYSSYLLRHFSPQDFDVTILASRNDVPLGPDDANVIRCWDDSSNRSLTDLEEAIVGQHLEVVVFQFNFGFLRLAPFGKLIESLKKKGITVVITLHSTADVEKPHYKASLKQIQPALSLADRILVHGLEDLNSLKKLGLSNNVALFPHGVFDSAPRDMGAVRASVGLPLNAKILATYGFLLPNKGVEQLLEAFPAILEKLPESHLLLINSLYPNPLSDKIKRACEELIQQLHIGTRVTMINDFLAEEESIALLQAADLVVFPYQKTAESASGAIRFGLSSRRPVVCTPLEIFSDVRDITIPLLGTSPEHISSGINRLLQDQSALHAKADIQAQWLASHSWPLLARRLVGMVRGLFLNSRFTIAAQPEGLENEN